MLVGQRMRYYNLTMPLNPRRVLCVAVWLGATPLAPALELEKGDLLAIRLASPVCSYTARPGDRIFATLLGSHGRNGDEVLTGAQVLGAVEGAHRVGLGVVHSTARLELHFTRVAIPGQEAIPIEARLRHVDDARERVDKKGRIQGINAAGGPANRITSRMKHLPGLNLYPDLALLTYKLISPLFPDPEIHYDIGTEMWLELTEPLHLPDIDSAASRTPPDDLATAARKLAAEAPARTSMRGIPADVVNLLFVGSRAQLEQAFRTAGWMNGDPASKRAFARSVLAGVEYRSYKTAPMSMQRIDGEAPAMMWQKSLNSYRKRHHARAWKLAAPWEGRDVWAAAATHDLDVGVSLARLRVFHRIEPNIDLERAKVARDFVQAGCVERLISAGRPDAPRQATNATGDAIRTDGAVTVVVLKDCAPPAETAAEMPHSRHGSPVARFARQQILSVRYDLVRANIFAGGYELGKLVRMAVSPHRKIHGFADAPASAALPDIRGVRRSDRLGADTDMGRGAHSTASAALPDIRDGADPHTSAAVPGEVKTVASVGGVERDAVDVAPVVDRQIHGPTQPQRRIVADDLGAQPSAFGCDYVPGEVERPAAVGAEGSH